MDPGARFACTSCGACCNRGPEMELSETTRLADTFVLSLLFKVHSLPLSERSPWADAWWRDRKSRIPLRPALAEAERHLRHFASRRIDKSRDRQVFLDISAIVDDDGLGRCPALRDNLCGIYEARPLTCRTVPLHYSRAPSTLGDYLGRFTATPDYRCDITTAAPVILESRKVTDRQLAEDRERAVALAKADRPWKDRILDAMNDGARAEAAGLPVYDAVLSNSDKGYAMMVPMIAAWRIAAREGLLSREALAGICRSQARLLKGQIARATDGPAAKALLDSLALYEIELARGEGLSPLPAA